MKRNKIIAIFLSLVLILCLMPGVVAVRANAVDYDQVTVTLSGDWVDLGDVRISSMDESDGRRPFPDSSMTFYLDSSQDSYTFTFSPMPTYNITALSIDGVAQTVSAGEITCANIAKKDSYSVSVTTENNGTHTIVWAYEGSWDPDALIEHGRVSDISADGIEDMTGGGDEGGHYVVADGKQVTVKLTPDPGYQVKGAMLNGFSIAAADDPSTFKFTMPSTHVHFKGVFVAEDNPVSNQSSLGAVVNGQADAVSEGNVNGNLAVALSDTTLEPAAQIQVANAAANAGSDSVSVVQSVDINTYQILSKGSADSSSYSGQNASDENFWTTQKTSVASPLTFALSVTAGGLSEGETYGIVKEHGGNYTELTDAVYNSTTQQLRFDTNEFSVYTIIKKSGTPETDPTPIVQEQNRVYTGNAYASCDHVYEWSVIKNATEEESGIYAYVCQKCGDIKYKDTISAYATFNINTMEKINKAAPGDTIEITTKRWISFNRAVMEAFADKKDVTLKVNHLSGGHKGENMSFTIPAGTDTREYLDENGYAGFLYLGGIFKN